MLTHSADPPRRARLRTVTGTRPTTPPPPLGRGERVHGRIHSAGMEGGVGPPTETAINNGEKGESRERQEALIVSAVDSSIDSGRQSPAPREGPSKEKM
jgi:hypothetical protein